MDNTTSSITEKLDQKRALTEKGAEYWMGRDIQEILGYVRWDRFAWVIRKAMMACESGGIEPKHHFSRTGNLVSIGSGAQREEEDYFLSRYACYLVAMNGSPSKEEVATAQRYFAVQTRKQEKTEKFLADSQKRIELRDRVKNANKHLNSAAKAAGVQNYAFFHDSGYRGLYDMGLSEVRERKGISKKEDFLDRAGRTELAMNEFRITQTEEVLIRNKIRGESNAKDTHFKIGQEVRSTVRKLGGTMPENLPAEPSIKKLIRGSARGQIPENATMVIAQVDSNEQPKRLDG